MASEVDNPNKGHNSLQERTDEGISESSRQPCMSQECFYQDDSMCPCYMCNNHGIDSKSTLSDDGFSGVEFAIRTFWRIAKTQNDIESPTEGNSKGFHYRLLLHPRGTAGTDSESSHLSVFVEAVVQDWYPEYWVFPNVRFELTVVNFKDPKQSVTSWAHWSFSSDATSRGWQKMISHSRLTKAAGFMDDEGTVVIRGKAEPPYSSLWSRSILYQPQMMWEYIPDRAQREICSEICNKLINNNQPTPNHTTAPDNEDENITDVMLLKCLDSVVPAVTPTLDSDFLALMVHILYHLREFRRSVLMWNYEFDADVTEETSVILALQKVFAYMYLYPLAVSCRTYKLSAIDNPKISKYYLYELVPKTTYKYKPQYFQTNKDNSSNGESTDNGTTDDLQLIHDKYDHPTVNCCSFDGGRYEWEVNEETKTNSTKNREESEKTDKGGYRLVPGSLSYSIGERPDIFSKLLPPPPNLKAILKAMHMTDLQTMEPQEQLVNLHSEMFTMILRDLASAKKVLKQRRIKSNSSESISDPAEQEKKEEEKTIPLCMRDQTLLESTCKFLFSGSPENETLFRNPSVDDISTIYIRCKHSNSLQKALEATPKTMTRYPQVLFFYLYPTKNAKKGELFDVPLRLDCTSIKSTVAYDNMSDDSRNTNNYDDYGVFECSEDEDDAFGEFDNVCEKEHTSVKWYSLYALIIKEGDLRYEGLGKGTSAFNTLLLRPEEDGPWYRMSEGKVEKLTTKMDFTEWKCHRDFFCVSAVYIAEDYIDMLQVGEVDLVGNLKQWNPNLYYSTLSELGVSEQEILLAIKYKMNQSKKENDTDESSNGLIKDNSVPKDLKFGKQFFNPKELEQKEDLVDKFGKENMNSIYDYLHLRRVGQNHPRLSSCCEVHGYNYELLMRLDEKERRLKYEVPVTKRDMMRRLNRLNTIAPFVSWLFNASKENTALLNGINPPADGKLLVNFLQKRERIFEEEFRHLISEMFFKEMAENLASNGIYTWNGTSCSCGCSCKTCLNKPAMLLTQNGRFPGESLKSYLSEPATILFRNIQILRCHLEYFCKDCRNLTLQFQEKRSSKTQEKKQEVEVQPIQHLLEGTQLQLQYQQFLSNLQNNGPNTNPRQNPDDIVSHKLVKYEFDSHPTLQQILNPHKFEPGEKGSEMSQFKSTSERSALFLIECIWDACVRYTMDCRTILFLKACSIDAFNKGTPAPSTGFKNTLMPSGAQCKDLFVFDGSLGSCSEFMEHEEMNYADTKYDLTPKEELEIMKHFSKKYQIPSVSDMRNYLRRQHVLVFSLIRPHELLRSYLEHKYKINFVEELEKLGYNVVWNEEAFNQKASLSDLSESELKLYGINNLVPDSLQGIGHHLCNIYERMLTKMLVHMQDVDKQIFPNCFDYVYTVRDIASIVQAIKLECDKTLGASELSENLDRSELQDEMGTKHMDNIKCGNSCGNISSNMHLCSHEGCVCLGHECRYNFGYTGYILPFWIANEMADLTVFTNSQLQAYNESLIEDLSELCLKSDDKKKKKVKPRKQTLEKVTCIIPPLDVKLKQISFDQFLAYKTDPMVFMNPNTVARFYYKRDKFLGKQKFSQLFNHTNPYKHNLNTSLSYLSILNINNKKRGSGANTPTIISEQFNFGYPDNKVNNKLKDSKEKGFFEITLKDCDTGKFIASKSFSIENNESDSNKVKNSIEIGILTTHDLFGLEGFSCETKVVPTKRLFVNYKYHGLPTKVYHLYWAIRKLINSQMSDELLTLGSNRPKKKLKCICDNECPDENECPVKQSWRPCAGDCFMLYALKNDMHSLRIGKKFVYMQPGSDLSYYLNPDKARGPDITVLICGAPSSFYLNGASTWFPLQDDSDYPLLIFKWMCVDMVDLVCLGAIVCDSKKQLQQYIFEWLLPIIKELGYLSSNESGKEGGNQSNWTNKDEDVDRYQVLEECSVRSVQNVRRWSCAIKKINKRSGDVIITQLKRTVDSPATMRFKESVLFMNLVKELTELEALELLPDTNNFYSDTWSKPQQDQPDLVNKLSKKKKRKSTKSAIPSNKKSTFSKRVQPTQIDDEDIDDDKNEDNSTLITSSVDNLEHTERGEGQEIHHTKEKDKEDEDESYFGKDNRDVYSMMKQKLDKDMDDVMDIEKKEHFEHILEELTESDKEPHDMNQLLSDFKDLEHLEDKGYLGAVSDMTKQQMQDTDREFFTSRENIESFELQSSVYKTPEELQDDISLLTREGQFRRILDLCPTLGLENVCEEVFSMFENELKRDFVQLGKRLKNLLKLVKMLCTRISRPEPVRDMVKKIHETHSLKAGFLLSHLLSDYNPTIPLMDDVLEYVLQDVMKYSYFLFTDKNEYIRTILNQMVNSLYKNTKITDKFDSSLLFLIYVIANPKVEYPDIKTQIKPLGKLESDHDRLECEKQMSDENPETLDSEELSENNVRTLLQKKMDLVHRRTIKETFLFNFEDNEGLVTKPMLEWLDEEIEQFERFFLQQLKVWWNTRQMILDKIKSNIHATSGRFKDSLIIHINNNVKTNAPGKDNLSSKSGKDELFLDLFEFRILLYFVENYPEITLCFNRDSITLYFSGKIDKRAFLKSIKESRQFFGSKNTIRSIPNLAIEHTDTTSTAASLMDMQLNNNKTALLLLSIKYSSFSQQVDSQFLKSISSYKTYRSFNIPPPPSSSASLVQDSI
uniref:MATH domain-containing protein n=1 Tax=Theileria annulata TaxID=5874 RepID=A0A3B0MFL8_THEAN